ncbi:MAG TPA: M28 family peptidase [Bacteroidales bacterium]|nr:M28 family peptidase [Bacteroidales bacterium]
MEDVKNRGWKSLMEGFPWFDCDGCYPLPAYSEFMPSPIIGQKPLGKADNSIFTDDDPWGMKITEIEEELELRPGISHIGHQIMNNITRLGRGLTEHHIHGHGGKNLTGNPYWPAELAAKAGKLEHERFVVMLPMMLSRTQDDKGRVTWTFFGSSIHDPEFSFWKGFYRSENEAIDNADFDNFFSSVFKGAYGLKAGDSGQLYKAGLRILPCGDDSRLPGWTDKFRISVTGPFDEVRFLLTFKPFSDLPQEIQDSYLNGRIHLLPFPGSLVFWGMPTYERLRKHMPEARQIALHNLVARNRGIGGMRVTQSGWFHEPHPDNAKHNINEELILNSFHRTHRWEKIHRYQDELNQSVQKIKIAKALFSTEPDSLGLYDKPLARNCQIWDHNFDLLLNGPRANRKEIYETEKKILNGGLFGYRFFYPPMKTGRYSIYWIRPLVGWLNAGNGEPEFHTGLPAGFITCYHEKDSKMDNPVELWPRIQQRKFYLSALRDFTNGHDHYAHQTSRNIISLLEAWRMQGEKPLKRTLAHRLLNLAKHKTLEQWLDELGIHTSDKDAALGMRQYLETIIEPAVDVNLPEPITYDRTATRSFEEAWWNEIKYLAHGEFVNKDNADVITDPVTRSQVKKQERDIEYVGNYFINRYRKIIAEAGMEGKAFCGELPFKWQTDFEYSLFGGWMGNQDGSLYERNILMVIPGKNRKEAVVFGDHYDTAYMEDVYDKGSGGTGARISANGADDNFSASTTLLLSAPIFLDLARQGKLERDIWLIHLTGEEFPSDCMGARNFCRKLIEKNVKLRVPEGNEIDLSGTEVVGLYVMDMIGHNRDNDHNIFQISPGKSEASLRIAREAHTANMIWNNLVPQLNKSGERAHLGPGKRVTAAENIPQPAQHLAIHGEVRTQYNPHSSIFNTDGQIFSDMGVPVVLFMENYDISRQGYHDTHDTMENIDLDYGSAFAAIAIETVARVASSKQAGDSFS